MMQWIVFTAGELPQLEAWSQDTEYKVYPRLVDSPDHTHFGTYVANDNVTATEYNAYWSDKLVGYPRIVADADDLFVPSDV